MKTITVETAIETVVISDECNSEDTFYHQEHKHTKTLRHTIDKDHVSDPRKLMLSKPNNNGEYLTFNYQGSTTNSTNVFEQEVEFVVEECEGIDSSCSIS